MNRTFLTTSMASLAAAMFAPEGLGLGLSAESRRTAYIVHKDEHPGTLELSPSGRVVTEAFDMPEWAGGVVLALLAERTTFYTGRLGADMAEPMLTSNVINFDDLNWVALDDDGLEVEIIADDEYRQSTLAAAIGINRDTGDIDAAVTEFFIDRDNVGYTLQDIADKADVDAVFAVDESKQAATGQ